MTIYHSGISESFFKRTQTSFQSMGAGLDLVRALLRIKLHMHRCNMGVLFETIQSSIEDGIING